MKLKMTLSLLFAGLFVAGATASTRVIRGIMAAPATIDMVQVQESLAGEASSDIQVVLLALQAEGFEPAEIRLSPGEYLFVVRNRSGQDETDVRLARENGEPLGHAKVRARRSDWKQRLKLTPGVYLLRETSHPEWTCRIVVDR